MSWSSFAIASLLAPAALAFAPSAHEELARTAWRAEGAANADPACLSALCAAFVAGTAHEDWNTPTVKWLRSHHFHHPGGGPPTTFREDPLVRVRELWTEALEAARAGDEARAWDRVGHAAHLVQDMASPPHVVPVMHGPADAFEAFASADRVRAARDVVGRDPEPIDAGAAIEALSRRTLAAVSEEGSRWSAFWLPDPDGGWGRYGTAGNTFGADLPVSEAFAQARIVDAVDATRAFLRWALPRLRAPDPGPVEPWRAPPLHAVEVVGGFGSTGLGAGLHVTLGLPFAFGLEGEWQRTNDDSRWILGLSRVLASRWIRGVGGVEVLAWAGGGRPALALGGMAMRVGFTEFLHLRIGGAFGAAHDDGWRPVAEATLALGLRWADP